MTLNQRERKVFGAGSATGSVLTLLVIIVFFWMSGYCLHPRSRQKPAHTIAPAQQPPQLISAKPAYDRAKLAHLAELGTVRTGEGAASPLQRQLTDDPNAENYSGNLVDRKTISTWAGKQANLYEVANGYYDPRCGREKRVRHAGVVYLLVGGKVSLAEALAYAASKDAPKELVLILEHNVGAEHRMEAPGYETHQTFEYIDRGEI